MSSDPRLQLARELAGRGLTHASLNDLAKAVLLLIDLHVEKDPKQTQIGRDALEGKAPPLL